MRVPHKPGKDIMKELSSGLYPSIYEAVRELITNSADAIVERIQEDPNNSFARTITIIYNEEIYHHTDQGTGLKDENIARFEKYGEYKTRVAGIGGYKGFGKLAQLRLGDLTENKTNNGNRDYRYVFDISDPDSIDKDIGQVGAFLQERGFEVMIKNPETPASMMSLRKYLEECFVLKMLVYNIKIIFNGEPLKIDVRFKSSKTIAETKHGVIYGNIIEDKKGRGEVDVYTENQLLQKKLTIDPTRLASGWINYNAFTPTTARTEIIKDNIYIEFIQIMQKHLRRFPKRREAIITKSDRVATKKLLEKVANVLKDAGIIPKGELPTEPNGDKSEFGIPKPPIQTRPKKPNDEPKPPNPIEDKPKLPKQKDRNLVQELKTRFGLDCDFTWEGNEKQPVYFVVPNKMTINRTNKITEYAYQRAKRDDIPIKLYPYVSRAMVYLKPNSDKFSVVEFMQHADIFMRKLLSA